MVHRTLDRRVLSCLVLLPEWLNDVPMHDAEHSGVLSYCLVQIRTDATGAFVQLAKQPAMTPKHRALRAMPGGDRTAATSSNTRSVRSQHIAISTQVASFCGDLVSVVSAFWIAYLLRYTFEVGGEVSAADRQSFDAFQRPIVIALVVLACVFSLRGIYVLDRSSTFLDNVPAVAGGFTTVMATVVLLAFFMQFNPSRLIFLFTWIIGCVLMVSHRAILAWIRRVLWQRGIGVQRVLVVGSGETGRRIMQALSDAPTRGTRLVGYAATEGPEVTNVAMSGGVRVYRRLGTPDDLPSLVNRHSIDEVIILPAQARAESLVGLMQHCRDLMVKVSVVPDIVQFSLDRVDLAELGGLPLIGVKDASIRGWHALTKRTIDVVASLLILSLAAVPMLVIAIMIKRDTPGPVIYRQERVGKDGRRFQLLKFRCMLADADALWDSLVAESHGADHRLFKLKDDPRVTRTGLWMRRYSLDELPQFLQVLKGDMSLIGPRPPLPREVEGYDEWHLQRLLVQPGLTGLWQVNGRSSLSFDEMVRLDLFYAENWSPWLDAKILLRTIPAVVRGRGAY